MSPLLLQDVVAKVTADNLMFLLRIKSLQARADAANAEADQLRAAALEGRDPWLTQVGSILDAHLQQLDCLWVRTTSQQAVAG